MTSLLDKTILSTILPTKTTLNDFDRWPMEKDRFRQHYLLFNQLWQSYG